MCKAHIDNTHIDRSFSLHKAWTGSQKSVISRIIWLLHISHTQSALCKMYKSLDDIIMYINAIQIGVAELQSNIPYSLCVGGFIHQTKEPRHAFIMYANILCGFAKVFARFFSQNHLEINIL